MLLRGVMTFMFFGVDAYVSLTLEEYRGLSAVVAGIVLTAATVSWTAGSWIQARNAERWPTARFVTAGFLVALIGLASFGIILVPEVPVIWAVPTFAIAGLGMGLGYAPLSLIVLREAAPGTQGTASSALSLSDTLGTAMGTGVSGAIIAAGLRTTGSSQMGLAIAFTVAVAVGIGGFFLTRRLRRTVRVRAPGGHRHAREPLPGLTSGHPVPRGPRLDGPSGWGRLRAGLRPAPPGARRPCEEAPIPMSAEELRAKIREIPDFPKPGILFYDITTLLKDRAAYKEAIDLMCEPYKGEQHRCRRRDGVAWLHLQRPARLPARGRTRAGPQAGQAAGRDDHRRIRARIRLEHARDPSRRHRAGPDASSSSTTCSPRAARSRARSS